MMILIMSIKGCRFQGLPYKILYGTGPSVCMVDEVRSDTCERSSDNSTSTSDKRELHDSTMFKFNPGF